MTGYGSINDKRDFVNDFLFGEADIRHEEGRIRTTMDMDLRTEGWIGLPHGGISMGATTELAAMLTDRQGAVKYPFTADFHMGGAKVVIGETVNIGAIMEDGEVKAAVSVDRDNLPYLTSTIRFANDDRKRREEFDAWLPASFSAIENRLSALPYYENCFVCGVGRTDPGLQRRFSFVDGSEAMNRIVISTISVSNRDAETFCRFQREEALHSLPFLALIDETMGWGGFLATASGGVTVRMGCTFYRDISVNEKVVVFGRGVKVRGKTGGRIMFWASGGAAVLKDDGSFETVIAASGQWFGIQELTEQMKTALIPREHTLRAFDRAVVV